MTVLSYSSANDGGGGPYYWDPSDATADNGGTVLTSNGTATGRWKRVFLTPIISVKWFGAKGDGVTDDRTVLAAADTAALAASVALELPSGTYRIASNLTLASTVIYRGGSIVPDSGRTLTVGTTGGFKMVRLTQSAYNALTPKDPLTLYLIEG